MTRDVTRDQNALGEFLRARREQVDPASVGLRVTGIRRTPGLRREEVATLAGISADYYLRLEQGRDRHPSAQVLLALSRVFGLDPAATDHLLDLAEPRPPQVRRPSRKAVPKGVLQLLEVLELPAFVEDRMFDVLAANELATALSPAIRPGQNRLRSLFLDEEERALHPDWEQATAGLIASFRRSIGSGDDDPRIAQLVGELSLGSEHFRRLWARHDVRGFGGGAARMDHPRLGMLHLSREKLPIDDASGQLLVIYHAEPGSATAAALRSLRRPAEEAEEADAADRPGAEPSARPDSGRGAQRR